MAHKLTDRLVTFFEKAQLPVLFAGAGVSAKAGLPTWAQYMSDLGIAANEYDQFTKYQIDIAIRDRCYEDAAAYYFLCRAIPENVKLDFLVKPLEKYNAEELEDLLKLPFQAAVTTNFDRSLLDAFAYVNKRAPIEANIDDPTLVSSTFLRDFYVARIHGRVEVPNKMRLTKAHLEQLALDDSYLQALTHILTRRQVLFVGYSFMDPAITTVLRAVKTVFRNRSTGYHVALVPDDAPADFVKELAAHDIERVTYSPSNGHSELWLAISEASKALRKAKIQPRDTTHHPFSVAKKYLATAYARMRLGSSLAPLSRAVIEGLVSTIVSRPNQNGLTEDEIVTEISSELSIERERAEDLVSQSLAALLRDGICEATDAGGRKFVGRADGGQTFNGAVDRLVSGAADRVKVREGIHASAPERSLLDNFFRQMTLRRGWDLGAAFAAHRMPETIDVLSQVREVAKGIDIPDDRILKLARGIDDLLRRPDDEEATILAELGRVAFGLELVLEAPHDILFHRATLPERIYLDANVLMPAITKWHPHYEVFKRTIELLQVSASRAAMSVSICVYYGFLNEIVSHRRLAIGAMEQNDGEGALWSERETQISGSANVNVFIGAYFNAKKVSKELSFNDFLDEVAPYHDESELRTFLESMGIRVLRESDIGVRGMPDILHALETFFSGALAARQKSPYLIRHDAFQVAMLNRDAYENRRSILVSADQLLRVALDRSRFGYLNNAIITHLGLAQLVELLAGRVADARGLASLLWMSSVSTETERVRTYLINVALAEHDAAMAMAMRDVVDALAEDAAIELSQRGVSLEADTPQDRATANDTLERYSSKFFEKMRAEVERLEKLRD